MPARTTLRRHLKGLCLAKNGDCHLFAPHQAPRSKPLSLKRIGWLYPIFRDACSYRRLLRHLLLVPAVAVLTLAGCSQVPPEPPSDIDLIFWEEQSWETGGYSQRLTLWADGQSEIRIVLGGRTPRSGVIRLRTGWTKTANALVKRSPLPPEKAQDRFERALKAGIHLLEPVRANYLDGSGTLVGVRIGGNVREVVIAHLSESWYQTTNYRRFQAVAEAMSDFDRDAIQREE